MAEWGGLLSGQKGEAWSHSFFLHRERRKKIPRGPIASILRLIRPPLRAIQASSKIGVRVTLCKVFRLICICLCDWELCGGALGERQKGIKTKRGENILLMALQSSILFFLLTGVNGALKLSQTLKIISIVLHGKMHSAIVFHDKGRKQCFTDIWMCYVPNQFITIFFNPNILKQVSSTSSLQNAQVSKKKIIIILSMKVL